MTIIGTPPDKTIIGIVATLDEAKRHLNLEATETHDDTIISDLLAAAIEQAEGDTNSDILEKTNVLIWDLEETGLQSLYRITQAPLNEFTKLEAWVNNQWNDISAEKYRLKKEFHYFSIEIIEKFQAEKLRFTFTTGYAVNDIPKRIKQAILIKLEDFYSERGSNSLNNVISNRSYEMALRQFVRTYH